MNTHKGARGVSLGDQGAKSSVCTRINIFCQKAAQNCGVSVRKYRPTIDANATFLPGADVGMYGGALQEDSVRLRNASETRKNHQNPKIPDKNKAKETKRGLIDYSVSGKGSSVPFHDAYFAVRETVLLHEVN